MSKRLLLAACLVSAIMILAASATTCLLAAPADAQAPKAKKAKAVKARPATAPAAATGAEGEPEEPEGPYKGIAKAFITDIANGKADLAIKGANDYLAEHPADLECPFCLAVAYSTLKQPDKAMEYVKQAVAGGLPIGRFHAGPRNLLAPLTETNAFRDFAAARPVELIHGPVLGAMTDTSVKVWVRTASEMTVQVIANANSKRSATQSPVVKTLASTDFTAVAELTGLTPDTTYKYNIIVGDNAPVRIDPAPTFRTFPAPGSKSSFQVVFGGGAGYTPPYERMWDTLAKHRPLAFLAMGDNVYIDEPECPEAQRYCYYRRQSRPEYRRFVSATPMFAIWDDHDFRDNDGIGSPGIDDMPWKIPVWNVFKENFVNPSYGGGPKQPGVWFDFTIDGVHFIMLDCRYYRTSPKLPTPTMIGPAQKKWLLETLNASKTSGATFTVLASSVPWTTGTKPGSKDTWDGFPQEREEIFSFIKDNRIEGVFLISADRHRSDAYKNDRPGAYPLYEASSSKLTNVHTHGLIKKALFGYNAKCSFGLLTFDTAAADPELTYDVYNIDDEKINTLKVKRSELSFK